MTEQTEHSSVARVRARFAELNVTPEVRKLSDTARSAKEAADGLNVEVGQIASSIVFTFTTDTGVEPLLVVTSGRHRVDTEIMSSLLPHGTIGRADADFVRTWSGFAIGGVSPVGWQHDGEAFSPLTFIDESLAEYTEVWAAAGHTHVVFQSTFIELVEMTAGTPAVVAHD